MNILGIVAEYNPFHNGHLYHLQKSLETTNADATIAVMSGNFIQRGEPALLDKFTRADIAIKNGMLIAGTSPDNKLVEMVEIKDHMWAVGAQFHPELKSRPNRPAPVLVGLVEAAKKVK